MVRSGSYQPSTQFTLWVRLLGCAMISLVAYCPRRKIAGCDRLFLKKVQSDGGVHLQAKHAHRRSQEDQDRRFPALQSATVGLAASGASDTSSDRHTPQARSQRATADHS